MAAAAKEANAINGEKAERAASETLLTGALDGFLDGDFDLTTGTTFKERVISSSTRGSPLTSKTLFEFSFLPSSSKEISGTVRVLSVSTETVKVIFELKGSTFTVLMLLDKTT